MARVGDISVINATEASDGRITMIFRVVEAVDSKGIETAGVEHICTATPDELAAAGVDPADAAALTAHLGRNLIPAVQPTKRTDLIAAVSFDAIAVKEEARVATLAEAAVEVAVNR